MPAIAAEARSASTAGDSGLRSHVFGIPVAGDVPFESLPPAPDRSGRLEPTRLALASERELEDGWSPVRARRLEELRLVDGRLAMSIDHEAGAGYRLVAGPFGRYRLSDDGLRALCGPTGVEAWRMERFLCARVLPLAATLRGREVLHASAVSIGGAAAALVGPSHAGKTSLAVRMILEGAGFLTDDLLALEPGEGGLVAHPGPGLAGVRYAEERLLREDDAARLGDLVDRGDKVYASPARVPDPVPLRVVYLLGRDRVGERLGLERLPAPDPRLLLGSSFFTHVALTPDRLSNQLEVCAELARSVVTFRVAVPPTMSAAALGSRLMEHFSACIDPRGSH